MELTELLLNEDVRTLLKIVALALALLIVWRRLYAVAKENDRSHAERQVEMLGWLSDYPSALEKERQYRAVA